MPLLVKTTAFPVVVAPPATGVPGGWEIEVQTAGAPGLYRGPEGRLLGFALAGEAVANKNALTRVAAHATLVRICHRHLAADADPLG